MNTVNQDARGSRDPLSRRWERLEELFATAADLPRERQREFVERETECDPETRRELRALLDCDCGARARITCVIDGAARAAAVSTDWVGQRIGHYRILREIGRGGMGIVFQAAREGDEYQKIVALKLAPWWRNLDLLRERFRHEGQILASLEHPNIALFLDGGMHQGTPYFAMEYVQGVALTTYAELRGLTVREKIELFRSICGAVHYAHQSLVVHRDLKPGNILVTDEGVPKLLDFGIAKLLSPAQQSGQHTVTGGAPWTPNYASPEQVRALPITTRTDVYSLGLILYELLTGERGQMVDTSSPMAMDRSVCEMEPKPASQRVAHRGDHALARQLRGDLDTIVAAAIRKEPDKRYGSAAALSDDLGRYLKGLPVEARAGTFGYRAWKLVRRHRTASAAALLIAASLTSGILATAYQAHRAERRFQQARRLANSLLFGVPDRLQSLAGATETREWAVRTAMDYLNDLAKDAGGDKSMLAELAAAYLKIGDVQGYPGLPNLGHREAAMVSYRKAETIAERLAAGNGDPGVRRLLARSRQRVGTMLRNFRQTDASIAEFRRALEVAEPLYSGNPTDSVDSELLVTILTTFGQAQSAAGDAAAASRSWLRAAEVEGRSVAAKGNTLQEQRARTGKYALRALMYSGDLEGAERAGLEGVRVREALAAGQPANAALRRELANSYGDLAYVYFHLGFLSFGDRETAAAWHEKSLAIARELAAADPNNVAAQSDLAITEMDLCAALNGASPAKAIRYCRDSLALAARWPQINAEEGLAQLANGLQRLGRLREARNALGSAMGIRRNLHEQDPRHFVIRQELLRNSIQMAGLLLDMGDVAGSLEQHREAVALAEELSAAVPTNLLARRDLADAYEALGRYFQGRDHAQARVWYQKSLDLWNAWPRLAHTGRMDQARRLRAQKLLAVCK